MSVTSHFDPHEDDENSVSPTSPETPNSAPAWADRWTTPAPAPDYPDHRPAIEEAGGEVIDFADAPQGSSPIPMPHRDEPPAAAFPPPPSNQQIGQPLRPVADQPPAHQGFNPQQWFHGNGAQAHQAPPTGYNEVPTTAYRTAPPLAPAPGAGADHALFSDGAGEVKQPPSSGARRLLFNVSGGAWNLGPSKADRRRADLVGRMNVSPGTGGYKVAVITVKGGAGKTTAVAALLTALGRHVDSSGVLGIDANPATGTLADRIDRPNRHDIRHLLANKDLFAHGPNGQIDARDDVSYPNFTTYTGKSSGNFEVVQGSENLAAAHMLTSQEYNALLGVAQNIFPLIVTDCGTEMHHPVTQAALASADLVVVVTGTARGTVKKARQALKFLNNYPADLLDEDKPLKDPNTGLDIAEFRHLVSRAIVLVNHTGQHGTFNSKQLHQDFAKEIAQLHANDTRPTELQSPNTSRVLDLPFDKHLGLDGPIVYDLLQKSTQWSMLELAAAIGDDFEAAAQRHYIAAQRGHRAPVGSRR